MATELGIRLGASPVDVRAELRAMAAADWPAAALIYWDGIRSGLATFEVEVPSWETWNEEHLTEPRLVATVFDEVVGWAALNSVSARRCYAGVAENSVYVADGWRGRGIGRLLLDGLIRRAEDAGIWTIQTSIFAENRASVGLHLGCGFRIVGVRERIAKRDGLWRDTLLLERRSEVGE